MNSRLKWRYVDNLRPVLAYQRTPSLLTSEANRVLRDLNRDGIACTTVEALLQSDAPYHALLTTVEKLEHEQGAVIEQARASVAQDDRSKAYQIQLLGLVKHLSANDPFVGFALTPPILEIANAYFGMYTRLASVDVWRNFTTDAPATESQLWHRDPEDRHILKVFVHLSDVDMGAGPFTYAAGSHLKGKRLPDPESFKEPRRNAPRSTDDQMAAVVGREHWVTAMAPKGTILFADTRGYHKGGLCRAKERLLYMAMFTSQALNMNVLNRELNLSDNPPADPARAFALGF